MPHKGNSLVCEVGECKHVLAKISDSPTVPPTEECLSLGNLGAIGRNCI